jgi:hypothetical protein
MDLTVQANSPIVVNDRGILQLTYANRYLNRPFAKETHVFARRVYMHLKPHAVIDLMRKIDSEVIPVLRKQKGFRPS